MGRQFPVARCPSNPRPEHGDRHRIRARDDRSHRGSGADRGHRVGHRAPVEGSGIPRSWPSVSKLQWPSRPRRSSTALDLSVIRLDIVPPTKSFPSGHTAAAIALYLGLAILTTPHVQLACFVRSSGRSRASYRCSSAFRGSIAECTMPRTCSAACSWGAGTVVGVAGRGVHRLGLATPIRIVGGSHPVERSTPMVEVGR